VGFVREQMRRKPIPIIIMSIANENAEAALDALDCGAVDFVQKPTALASEKIYEVSNQLIDKVKAAGNIAPDRIQVSPEKETMPKERVPSVGVIAGNHTVDIVALGVSTGGPQALKQLIP